MTLIANARMYAVAPPIRDAWAALFDWVSTRSGVPLKVIDHAYPAPLDALWSRGDLGAAFICGFPYMLGARRAKPIAAPIPSGARYGGKPVYVSDLVVRADSPFQSLEDTFGGRLGYTVEHSHSGFNALRHHLLPYRSADRPTLYRQSIGPLHTPRLVLQAVLDGTIDIGPLDGYALDLMRQADPTLQDRIRVVATTMPAPIPFLIASETVPGDIVSRLGEAFFGLSEAPETAELRGMLQLDGFSPVMISDYQDILDRDHAALAAGYPMPG